MKTKKTKNAFEDLTAILNPDESIVGIVFGTDEYNDRFDIPAAKQGVVLSAEEAAPLMVGWTFYGGFGGACCPPCVVWTTSRIIGVSEYDGATGLTALPRFPEPIENLNYL
jgi:hypothetical protein|tara:strand:+ start:131 stop:463 length:333 start_codon:yes stop_codon:yes gene_type:complete